MCPRVEILYEPGTEQVPESAAQTVADLAAEIRRNPRIADVQVVATMGRADNRATVVRRVGYLKEALERSGVDRRRLSYAYEGSHHGRGRVVFEAYRCDDGACASWDCVKR